MHFIALSGLNNTESPRHSHLYMYFPAYGPDVAFIIDKFFCAARFVEHVGSSIVHPCKSHKKVALVKPFNVICLIKITEILYGSL